jgi:hypothetical protein
MQQDVEQRTVNFQPTAIVERGGRNGHFRPMYLGLSSELRSPNLSSVPKRACNKRRGPRLLSRAERLVKQVSLSLVVTTKHVPDK